MANTNDITNTLFKSNQESILSSDIGSANIGSTIGSSSSNDEGFFGFLQNITVTTWLIIILILAFLGFNVFVYLAKGTQDITGFFRPLLQKMFGTTLGVTSQAIDVSAEGAKGVVSGTANAINTGLSTVQNITPNGANASSSIQTSPLAQPDNVAHSTLNKALNSAGAKQSESQEYQAAEASSSVHGGSQSGWCYIGEERGHRTCFEVGANDTCMSGEIFPTQEVCINPSLRA